MILGRLWLALALLVLANCGGDRPTSAPGNLVCNLSKYQVRDDYKDVYLKLRPAAIKDADATKFNVLELSAGGGFGAYGAGYLVGWAHLDVSAKPTARKDIQIVTGVSTGALMATHAFLATYDATQDWDGLLWKFYLNLSDPQLYSKRYLSLIWANSVYDTSRKTALLREHVKSDMISRVGTAPSDHGLFIGIVNLDSGEFVRIDMKALATGTFESVAQRDDCYRAVIDASTAVQVMFAPVFIDGQMMGDGGARQISFLVSPNHSPTSGLRNVKLRVFSFVHGDLDVGTPPGSKVRNGIFDIADRTVRILADQSMKSSIRLSNALAQDPAVVVGKETASKLPRFEKVLYAAAAGAACKCMSNEEIESKCGASSPNRNDIFCPAFMSCLAEIGKAEGTSAASSGKWLEIQDLQLGSSPSCQVPSPNFR